VITSNHTPHEFVPVGLSAIRQLTCLIAFIPDKKQCWSVLTSAGEDAHTTADLEIGATVSSIRGSAKPVVD